ncbi:hypothetical protein [Lentisalinibacter salinarum]|uniref:hypothetical protein n=1 Tax=Lentisalinibacter salinarum TaxID=2992239 RepID=UPI00386E39E0
MRVVKTLTRISLTALLAGMFAVGISACEEDKGPAEKAGERVDEAIEETGDTMEEAAEEAGDELEEAADRVEEKTDSGGY